MKKLTNIDILSADTHEGLEEKLNRYLDEYVADPDRKMSDVKHVLCQAKEKVNVCR